MTGIKQVWTEARIEKACAWIVERLEADFEGAGLPAIELRVDPAWQNARKRPKATGVSPDDVIVVCGGHEFPLYLAGGVEGACGHTAYQLQDDVIGEHGQGWPELVDQDGGFVGVLVPSSTLPAWRGGNYVASRSVLLVSCVGHVRLPG